MNNNDDTCNPSLIQVEGQLPQEGQRLLYTAQDPAPVDVSGITFAQRIQTLTGLIVQTFMASLPSNYVSQVVGPNYTTQFQVIAEQLATIQVIATEVYENQDFDFTRPEFLYTTLGQLVFPESDKGIPNVDGDRTYREFLKTMVDLLLKGSKKISVEAGAQLLTDAAVKVQELYLSPGAPIEQQFEFFVTAQSVKQTTFASTPDHTHDLVLDCNGNGVTANPVDVDGNPVYDHVHTVEEYRILPAGDPIHVHYGIPDFPSNPIQYSDNLQYVVEALKPAHTLYLFRFLFQDIFRRVIRDSADYELGDGIFGDSLSWVLHQYSYEDLRWYWEGAQRIQSSSGNVGTDRLVVYDNTRSFGSILPGATLTITSGPNTGTYRVRSVFALPIANDPTARPYTTSGALTGTATVVGGKVVDSASQDFGTLPEGSTITFVSGPNAGTYRIFGVAGNNGGSLGGSVSGDTAIIDATRLRLQTRLPTPNVSFSYEVTVDLRGRSIPVVVTAEDVSSQFFL